MLSHSVYFSLRDASPEACQKLVAQCRHWLDNHDGVRFFAVGTLAAQYDRPVNDRAFQVALQLVFDTTAAHDAYQVSERHQAFIAANRDNWAQVRVFDADV